MKKRLFEILFAEICKEKGYKINFYSEGWLIRIKNKKNKILNLVGYNFPLNSISTYQICLDKFICFIILKLNKIPTVEYFLIHNHAKRKYLDMGGDLQNDLEKILNKINFPIVVKPTQGTGGKNVSLCKNLGEVEKQVNKILETEDVVVSEFVDSEFEFRFIVLDGGIELAYKKVRNEDWKHNLSSGAQPQILGKKEIKRFEKIIKNIVKALDLKIGAIDFLIKNGKPVVLEVNSGIAMDHFGGQSLQNREISKRIYTKILNKIF